MGHSKEIYNDAFILVKFFSSCTRLQSLFDHKKKIGAEILFQTVTLWLGRQCDCRGRNSYTKVSLLPIVEKLTKNKLSALANKKSIFTLRQKTFLFPAS